MKCVQKPIQRNNIKHRDILKHGNWDQNIAIPSLPGNNTCAYTYVSPWRKVCALRLVGVARAEHMERPVMGESGEGPPQSWVVLVTGWVGSGGGGGGHKSLSNHWKDTTIIQLPYLQLCRQLLVSQTWPRPQRTHQHRQEGEGERRGPRRRHSRSPQAPRVQCW